MSAPFVIPSRGQSTLWSWPTSRRAPSGSVTTPAARRASSASSWRMTRPGLMLSGYNRDAVARILVADDHDDARSVFASVLRDAGHEVLEAADGMQALRVFEEHRPDLAL